MSLITIVPVGELQATSWEQQYQATLRANGRLSLESRLELEACTDAAYKFLDPTSCVSTRIRGTIVGAVQSGKTALMINIVARALDSGYRIVIVLAGLKEDLRSQTALRFVTDLLQRGDPIPGSANRSSHPQGSGFHGTMRNCWTPRFYEDAHTDDAFVDQFLSALSRERSTLVIVKKNIAALSRIQEALEYAGRRILGTGLPVLVIDDECDEASVGLDADAPTPGRIHSIWADHKDLVSYVGVTATPAANILQDPTSDLFPADFYINARHPGGADTLSTYYEPVPSARYTGGFSFYELLESTSRRNFLLRNEMSTAEFARLPGCDDELENALLAYFVSGAIRLAQQAHATFADLGQRPSPHTMLVHTDSGIDDHWVMCERIIRLIERLGESPSASLGNLRRRQPRERMPKHALKRWFENRPADWHSWYEDFALSHSELRAAFPDWNLTSIPPWDVVQLRLFEVIENASLRVVNSDESSVDRPLNFQSTFSAGLQVPPEDVYCVIVGGNRLSRGITIEGLCISYYTRNAALFLEDTTVQRERWFGYRGRHLEFCRLFTHQSVATRLRRFYEHEEDLRSQLAWSILNKQDPASVTLRFLALRDSLPTAKLGRGSAPLEIALSGCKLFLDRVQMGNSAAEMLCAAKNEQHVLTWCNRLAEEPFIIANQSGAPIAFGHLRVSADSISALFDGLQYTFHNTDASTGAQSNLREYYRLPITTVPRTKPTLPISSDPFSLAAYLRLWSTAFAECTSNPAQNRYRADDGISKWVPCPAPSFNLFVRIGSLSVAESRPFTFSLIDRAVSEQGVVGSRWGGRGYSSFGDEWIDLAPRGNIPEQPRLNGDPGLVLIHVIAKTATGRDSGGASYTYHRPCFGIVVPMGGPCIRYVLAQP